MQTTRRDFLRAVGTASAVAVTVGFGKVLGQESKPGGLFPLPAEVYSEPLYSMTSKQLEAFIGHTFTASSDGGHTHRLVLAEVNKLEHVQNTVSGYYGECYSLIFANNTKAKISQDLYEMSTDGLESFSALVVPTGRRLREYEIIVNHITR